MIFGKKPLDASMKPVTGDDLIVLLPQKQPFVFISALLNVSDSEAVSSFVFDAGHQLCFNGVMAAAGLMENMAQTCAAKQGYECWLAGKKIPLGFIGDIKDFEYTRLPRVGEELVTTVTIENHVFNITIISGAITVGGDKIASCKMKIFVDSEN